MNRSRTNTNNFLTLDNLNPSKRGNHTKIMQYNNKNLRTITREFRYINPPIKPLLSHLFAQKSSSGLINLLGFPLIEITNSW
jgi:hypothetical protein